MKMKGNRFKIENLIKAINDIFDNYFQKWFLRTNF